ncbi:MAG: Ig-like domain-containing protein [Patescibacteria group bacterium]
MKYVSAIAVFVSLGIFSLPAVASAMSSDFAQYTPGQEIRISCDNSTHLLEAFDITAGDSLYVAQFPCGSPAIISFDTASGHTYAFLEINYGSYCNDTSYNNCRSQNFFRQEIDVVVGDSQIAGTGTTLPLLSTNKTNYGVGETVFVTCQLDSHTLELYDITDGAGGYSLGEYPCGSLVPISFESLDGHTYAVLELDTGTYCYDTGYENCRSQNFMREEVHFGVGSAGSPIVTTPGTSKSIYNVGQTVYALCSNVSNVLSLFDLTDQQNIALGEFPCGSPANIAFVFEADHNYSLIEITNGSYCSDTSYSNCKLQNFFRAEYLFSVVESDEDDSDGMTSYRPDVTLLSPAAGDSVGKQATITYAATDENDRGTAEERSKLGLIEKPVSIYYSDKIAEWDHSIIPESDKVLIVKGLSAKGSYTWDTSALKPGVYYRLIIDALDAVGVGGIGETVSEPFIVDLDAPQFIVEASPASTHGADVTIKVTPTKELKDIPKVFVTQHGGKAIALSLKQDGESFVGVYSVVSGQDGLAEISVSGTDRAGNKGNSLVSGGTFAVGVDAPPKPKLSALPSVVGTSTISIFGTARNDTTIVLLVNGVESYTTKVAQNGAFSISNIKLSFDAKRGVNTLSVVARDQSGIVSEAAVAQVKFNKDPTVSFLLPALSLVSATTPLDVSASDPNLDLLQYTYQIISVKDFNNAASATSSENEWVTIADNISSHKFSWDSTEVEDGAYMLRAKVSDGLTDVYTAPMQITVRNTLPFLRFEDGRKTTVGTTTATVVGRALTPETISPRPTIAKVEYSLDQGKKWLPARIIAGAGTSDVRFSITLTNLADGVNGLLVRTQDSRKLYGRVSHPVVVDNKAPSAPSMVLRSGSVVTNENDSNAAKSGMQVTLSGRAEPQSTVTLTIGSSTKSVKASAAGVFVFTDIELARGTNTLALTATDQAGNTSSVLNLSLTYDNAPEISFINPKPSTGLEGQAEIVWRIIDADHDTITRVTLSYRQGSGAFIELPVEQDKNSFVWNVSRFAEGANYELRLTASDGIVTSSNTIGFYIDKTAPTVSSLTVATPTIKAGGVFKASGAASDALSGIEYVEYAITKKDASNEEKDWVRALVTAGYLKRTASFEVLHKAALEDGEYALSLRAVDAAGNTSKEEVEYFVVDATAPHVGSFSLIYKGVHIAPDQDGTLALYADRDVEFAVSLEDDTQTASLSYAGNKVPLIQDLSSGLFKAKIHATSTSSSIPLYIGAEDRLGNAFEAKPIGALEAVALGSVKSGGTGVVATVSVFAVDPTTGDVFPFVSKDLPEGSALTNESGEYELALPQGSYTLVAHAKGFETKIEKVELSRPQFVGVSFTTETVGAFSSFVQGVFDYFNWGL